MKYLVLLAIGVPQAPPLPQAPEVDCPSGCCKVSCECIASGQMCARSGCPCVSHVAQATLTVYCDPGARIYIDGIDAGGSGPVRRYVSDPFSAGTSHVYTVSAGGNIRRVAVRGGESASVDLRSVAPRPYAFGASGFQAPVTAPCGPRGG